MRSQPPPQVVEQINQLAVDFETLPPREIGRKIPTLVRSMADEGFEWLASIRGHGLKYDFRRALETQFTCLQILAALWLSDKLRGRGLTISDLRLLLGESLSERRLRGLVNGPLLPFTVMMEPHRDGDQRRVEYRLCLNPSENPDLDQPEREIFAGMIENAASVDGGFARSSWVQNFLLEMVVAPQFMEKVRRAGLTALRIPDRLRWLGDFTPDGEREYAQMKSELKPLKEFLVANDGLMLAALARTAIDADDALFTLPLSTAK